MSTVTIVVKLTAKEESIDVVKSVLQRMIAPTRQENGCLELRLHQDNYDPALFLFYEKWANLAYLKQYHNSDLYNGFVAEVGDLLAERFVNRMTEIS